MLVSAHTYHGPPSRSSPRLLLGEVLEDAQGVPALSVHEADRQCSAFVRGSMIRWPRQREADYGPGTAGPRAEVQVVGHLPYQP